MFEKNNLNTIQNKLDALVEKIVQKENSDEDFRITYAQILEKINTKMDVFSGNENFDKLGLMALEIRNMLKDRQEHRKKGEKLADFQARTQGIEMPLIEKIFDDLAPKYAERAKEMGQKGGYTRVIKTTVRRGDNAQMALVELV